MVYGFLARRDAAMVLVGFWGRLQADPRAARKNARLYRSYREGSVNLIRRAQALGHFQGHDPDALAVVVVGLVIGIAGQALFEEGAIDVDAAVQAAEKLL